ncbi:uncharacterized protein LOC119652085 [Hermetia illucens]|uniref:uncharacterized protein LOC119652085 n=1 Tax=Hermetia illucens TaxID=343691 RepID=UPI0018CC5A1E|nr:uncharacterized protein LOC119652085 [Hermetia illucens]
MSDILNVTRKISFDNSISKIEYHSYSPFLSSYNSSDEIRIPIQQQDLCILPSQSFIYIEGALTKTDGTISALAKLTNNSVAFLFDEIRYELNGVEIDRNKNVGITSTLKNYISLNENESKMLYNAAWSPNESITPSSGYFNFSIPLRKLLGFAEDYKKIIVNAKHELILVRTRSDENAFISSTDNVHIKIFKLQWKVPHVNPDGAEKLSMLKYIESGHPIQISFRNWELYEYPVLPTTTDHVWNVKTTGQLEKPRYVILALQTNRKNLKDKDASKFDHCDLTNIKIHLNSESYPYDDMNIKFSRDRFALLYDMYCNFQQSYYGVQPQPLLSQSEYKESAPIIVIDCSRQNESMKSGSVDIRLDMKTSVDVPALTTAYCLLLHDRVIEYNPLTSSVQKLV